jgi:hypothetical protein
MKGTNNIEFSKKLINTKFINKPIYKTTRRIHYIDGYQLVSKNVDLGIIKKETFSGMFYQGKNCPYCIGDKHIKCCTCNGCGKTHEMTKEYICNDCKGYGYIECPYCGGTGLPCIM